MQTIPVKRTGPVLKPDSGRVMIRPFLLDSRERVRGILERAMTLDDGQVHTALKTAREEFAERHIDIEEILLRHARKARVVASFTGELSRERELLIGSYFTSEYALESAALFNPSIVPHPDQTGLAEGELRFVLSLRATGEGHISSIEFRSGVIHADHAISMEEPSRFVTAPVLNPNPTYRKNVFLHKLTEMGFENDWSIAVMKSLNKDFTLSELESAMRYATENLGPLPREVQRTAECVRWLAESNYEVHFAPNVPVSERIIFPVSSNESNGMEDARFVRFVEDDGSVIYYATYTAYNGRAILPQLLETTDFLSFRAITLNGRAVQNKGMAFFPRRLDGRYAMISRQDDENLFLMFSDNPHFWAEPQILRRPTQPWEAVKIGNCGSPIETEAGWLVITHGVGPMRRYCIGAILLDLHDPTHVIGELTAPLVCPHGNEREGYVPNVVYTCGALVHQNRLILPYGLSDTASTIVTIPLDELLSALTAGS